MIGLKELNWIRTRFNTINRTKRNPIDTQTWVAITPIRTYKAYRAVGGAYFYQWDGMSHDSYNPFLGGIYHSGADEIIGLPKIKCESIEDGKSKCEANWLNIGSALLTAIATKEK